MRYLALLLSVFVLAGCVTGQKLAEADNAITRANYKAADQIAQGLKAKGQSGLILVATLADVTKLDTSTPLGRISGEQIASRLAQNGLTVVEVKFRKDLYIQQDTGEFMLARNIERIAAEYQASAVVVGTYAVAETQVLVSLRAVDAKSAAILSAVDYALPKERTLMSP